jgi:putative protease
MSPAGYWPQLHAAIEAGADSVYFGLKHFTARAKVGFSLDELPEAMRTLHARGVRGYVTFNTLVFDDELPEAAETLAAIAEAGVDAIIVQDFGALELARRIAPVLEIHGSTQMSITDAAGVGLAQRHGVSRVTLARELSLKEIRMIREASDCELEIFVHGALCVAYSGQCFSSEAWGGRSANRGQCAQACRLEYEMIVDGRHQPLGDARYLLSPGDLYALHHVPEIAEMGISALKIEGRYKDASYVALTTNAYRRAVDEWAAGREASITQEDDMRLEQVYSRGLGPFFLTGTDHQKVVRGRAPRHRGVLAGRVVSVGFNSVTVGPEAAMDASPLKPGDGVVFDAASWRSPSEPEEGGRIYHVVEAEGGIELTFANGSLNPRRIRNGDLVWRTDDPEIDRAARPFTEAASPLRKQPVHVHVVARESTPLRTVWSLSGKPGTEVVVESPLPLQQAQNRALDEAFLREQFGRLGNTTYELADIDLEVSGTPFAPASVLNAIRREATARLVNLQTAVRPVPVHSAAAVLADAFPKHADVSRWQGAVQLHLLVRKPEQLDAALALRPASITLDYLDLYGLKPSVERVRGAGLEVRVATPRILKPGEERVPDFLLKLDCAILVRSGGAIETLRSRRLTGDFSLNAANGISADLFLRMGLDRITPTHDLNGMQIETLASEIPADRLEPIAYGHLPVFHTEHCVFCRFLSSGTSYKDCGRPCEKHEVSLRDATGRSHPVIADVGCRNTVFGAEAQESSRHLDGWIRAGIRHFRLEFAHETAGQVTAVTKAFGKFFEGRQSSGQLARELRRVAPEGTTEGSLFVLQ